MDRHKEPIKNRFRKRFEKFQKKEVRRQGRYIRKVAKMTQSERDAELEKCNRKIAKYGSEKWKRLFSLRITGGLFLIFFAMFYVFLYWIGVSWRTFLGAFVLIATTFGFLVLLSSFLSAYNDARRERDEEKDETSED